jgi:hypothetical protein
MGGGWVEDGWRMGGGWAADVARITGRVGGGGGIIAPRATQIPPQVSVAKGRDWASSSLPDA